MAIAVTATLAAIVSAEPASALDSPWWRGDHAVILGYGCTAITLEPVDRRFTCPAYATHVHEAMDIDLAYGTPLYAGWPGVVTDVGAPGTDRHDYGPNYIRIWLDEGHDALLGHLSRALVKAGDRVEVGSLLGYSGDLGETDIPNLDFSVRPHGTTSYESVDPRPFLDFSPVGAGRAGARYRAAWSIVDGSAWVRRSDGGSWSQLPGGPADGFTAHLLVGYDASGHAFVLAASRDGRLWEDVEADAPAPVGTWRGWRQAGRPPANGLASPLLASTGTDGRLTVTAMAADGGSWTAGEATTAGAWSGWVAAPPVSQMVLPDTLHIGSGSRLRSF
jgi:hypothetical protein